MIYKINKDKDAAPKRLPTRPGVYRMLSKDSDILYVGKAGNLKNRLGSYFGSSTAMPVKTRALMSNTIAIEVTITRTEAEALVLENNLIKQHRPRYNVLLRDDKSYPYIYLSSQQDYPRLRFHRGARKGKGRYFGPFPNAGSVRRTLNLLQKLFQVRSCEDSVFKNRSRPCLQYQIKRCSAPCVNYISSDAYQNDIRHAVLFLEGKNEEVIESLYAPMQQASDALDFEKAAHYRDQIQHLRKIQEQELMHGVDGDVDIVACATEGGIACVQMFSIRNGLNLGSKAFFPRQAKNADVEDVLAAFLSQYYLDQLQDKSIPGEILISHACEFSSALAEALSNERGIKTDVRHRVKGERRKWLDMAMENARSAIAAQLATEKNQTQRLQQLAKTLKLAELERIECFDISHTQGNETVASCVVYTQGGMANSEYRRFNIRDVKAGDDYAAMQQALQRRYLRVKKEEGVLPDLILIDGGKGQTRIAREVMIELQLPAVKVIGVSKGPDRRAGQEKLILVDENATMQLAADTPALHLIQQIRDEAHRFAITGHRQRRKQQATHSTLEDIPGVGSKRRQGLLKYFGGMQGVKRAGVADLSCVPGINKKLAQLIYDRLHD